ncbi:hypothetical protein ON010_g2583 [Phytophthora cinnamomi]|nr:hypothetical protein ON010_g2583 [Phytophthora cinnamomi]
MAVPTFVFLIIVPEASIPADPCLRGLTAPHSQLPTRHNNKVSANNNTKQNSVATHVLLLCERLAAADKVEHRRVSKRPLKCTDVVQHNRHSASVLLVDKALQLVKQRGPPFPPSPVWSSPALGAASWSGTQQSSPPTTK